MNGLECCKGSKRVVVPNGKAVSGVKTWKCPVDKDLGLPRGQKRGFQVALA